jgi:hypothetical protein
MVAVKVNETQINVPLKTAVELSAVFSQSLNMTRLRVNNPT